MKYLTGIHALNLPCKLLNGGDWHMSALRWKKLTIRDTDNSPFGLYGLEYNREIPDNEGKYTIANHIRAMIDMIYEEDFSNANCVQDYIEEPYRLELFNKIWELKDKPNWKTIDKFMEKEYELKWLYWKRDEKGEIDERLEKAARNGYISIFEAYKQKFGKPYT